jgi:heptosyltransferase I
MSLPFRDAPQQLCILRLSAIGDISHTLPIVRTLQYHWPQTRLTWIIGQTEYGLVADIPGVEFIVFNKRQGWRAYWALYQRLKTRHFDALLHMQMSLRASLIALLVRSPIKLGFDKQRAKDLQWLFTTHHIIAKPRQHVIDSFFGFTQRLGIPVQHYEWNIPIPAQAQDFANQQLPGAQPILVISPCSSMAYRNWHAAGYAAVAEHAAHRHGLRVVLTGGAGMIERATAEQIKSLCHAPVIDLVGKSNLKELLAILRKASVVIAPDAGTAHLANAVGVPVIGLYATTNPDRARPYSWPQYVVTQYPAAVRNKFAKDVTEVPWGTRIRDPGTMDLIETKTVIAMLDRVIQDIHAH